MKKEKRRVMKILSKENRKSVLTFNDLKKGYKKVCKGGSYEDQDAYWNGVIDLCSDGVISTSLLRKFQSECANWGM